MQPLTARGYEIGSPFPTGRPDRTTVAVTGPSGEQLVAKAYPAGGGETTFENMLALWRSSFGERRLPPGLPRPVAYLDDVGVLLMERVAGRPLVEVGDPAAEQIEASMLLLADLHESDAALPRRRSVNGIVRSCRETLARSAVVPPSIRQRMRAVADALDAAKPPPVALVPVHGDFSFRNVLAADGRLVLIDLDRVRLSDPVRDVAYLGAWAHVWDVRRGRSPSWSVLERCVAAYEARRPQVDVRARLGFHVAAGIMRLVHGLFVLWPEDAAAADRLLDEAERWLA